MIRLNELEWMKKVLGGSIRWMPVSYNLPPQDGSDSLYLDLRFFSDLRLPWILLPEICKQRIKAMVLS